MEITQKKNSFFDSLVSVVMPVHNGEEFLREAIESVLRQTYTNFEFLIIENGSTDSSVEIIKSFNDPRIRLIIEEDFGQVQAYNRGFREAKGEYVFIQDQDDISDIQRFEIQLKGIIQQNADICGTFINLIDKNNNITGRTSPPIYSDEIRKRLLFNLSVIHNSSACIKTKVFNEIGFWNKDYFPVSDAEFFLRARENYKFINIPEFLYFWRKHHSQLSSKQTKNSRVKLKQLEVEYLSKRKNEFKICEYYFFKSLIFYYTDYLLYSLLYNFISILYSKLDRNSIRYFTILFFLGLPLKIFRKYDLLHSSIFLKTKTYLDKIINFSL